MMFRLSPWFVFLTVACHQPGLVKQRSEYAKKDQKRVTLRLTAAPQADQKLAIHFSRPAHRVSLGEMEMIDSVISNHDDRDAFFRFDVAVEPSHYRSYLLLEQDVHTQVLQIPAHGFVDLKMKFGVREDLPISEDIIYIKIIPRSVSPEVAKQVDDPSTAL